METSILDQLNQTQRLIDILSIYASKLEKHVVLFPKQEFENAVCRGFPIEFYETYCYKHLSLREVEVKEIVACISGTCIPYLEFVAERLRRVLDRTGNVAARNLTVGDFGCFRAFSELAKNSRDLEKVWKTMCGKKMSIEEADKQNANPRYSPLPEYIKDSNGDYALIRDKLGNKKYVNIMEWQKLGFDSALFLTQPRYKKNANWQYSINCATCTIAYVLRLRGFNVIAKGNPGEDDPSSLNYLISNSEEYYKVWLNQDGTAAEPVRAIDWMNKNNVPVMKEKNYRDYIEDVCKEKGVYVFLLQWNSKLKWEGVGGPGGHAAILQRDDDGKLYYIEPQVYEESKGADGKRSVDNLLMDGYTQLLDPQPFCNCGILRVDDKLFNIEYANLLEVVR